MSWAENELGKIKSINNTYHAELSESSSNTVADIYEKLNNLTES